MKPLVMELLDEHRAVIRRFFSKHHGREIKTVSSGTCQSLVEGEIFTGGSRQVNMEVLASVEDFRESGIAGQVELACLF